MPTRNTSEKPLPYSVLLPKLIREREGFSYRVLERYTGKSYTYWHNTVTGKRAVPKNDVLDKLAKIFNISPNRFQEYNVRLAQEEIKRNPEKALKILETNANYSLLPNVLPVRDFFPADNIKTVADFSTDKVPAIENADFAVVAQGNCLIGAHIADGDVIYIKEQDYAKSGDLVLIQGNGITYLRFFYSGDNCVILKCGNVDCEDISLNSAKIIGIRAAILRQ